MQNILKQNFYIPNKVFCEQKQVDSVNFVWLAGHFGLKKIKLASNMKLKIINNKIIFLKNRIPKNIKLIYNDQKLTNYIIALRKFIIAILIGFKKYLVVKGVGYKFIQVNNNTIEVILGFSHPLKFQLHPQIKMALSRKAIMLKCQSFYLTTLMEQISKLHEAYKPDPYKGKGIRYRKELIRRKIGKKRK